jgi:hypothetical protein
VPHPSVAWVEHIKLLLSVSDDQSLSLIKMREVEALDDCADIEQFCKLPEVICYCF